VAATPATTSSDAGTDGVLDEAHLASHQDADADDVPTTSPTPQAAQMAPCDAPAKQNPVHDNGQYLVPCKDPEPVADGGVPEGGSDVGNTEHPIQRVS
jgi:hypothetical protein